MKSTDKAAFTAIIAKTWGIYGKKPDSDLVATWFELLADFPLDTLADAFHRHLRDPEAGHYLPKPADLIRQINTHQPESGHPGAEEAWGLLIRFINDERESGVLTEEMREGWARCAPILAMGDEVGARMCFLETYRKALQRARETHNPPKWSLSMGTDPQRRAMVLQAAVEAGRISHDVAQSLLPPPAAGLEKVAGLLEQDGPPADPDPPSFSERWRDLAAQLRQSSTADEDRAMHAERERREALEAQQREIPVWPGRHAA